jgi:hypothetical protein
VLVLEAPSLDAGRADLLARVAGFPSVGPALRAVDPAEREDALSAAFLGTVAIDVSPEVLGALLAEPDPRRAAKAAEGRRVALRVHVVRAAGAR